MSCVLWWVRDDLRLHDNQCLSGLQRDDRLLPVAIWPAPAPPVEIAGVPLGFPRSHPRRLAFRQQGLLALREQLRARGSDLLLLEGVARAQLAELAALVGAELLRCSHATGSEEVAEQAALQRTLAPLGLRSQIIWQHTLVPPDALPFAPDALPRVFTTFRTQLEKVWHGSPALPTPAQLPELPTLPSEYWAQSEALAANPIPPAAADPRSAFPFAAGERAALARLDQYVFQRRALGHYKETRNGLLGHDYSSKFSPWLAQGSLSARQIHAAVRDYERQFGSNASTYWLVFELLWRDFFEFTAARHGPALYWRGGIQRKTRAWRHALSDFQRWCQGETGDDFVDAGLRELATSGYLSNRARQNVASFLVHELGIDWRWGAAWFEHHLLDYAPASNYGNWQYIAGVGNDPRPVRRFDTQAQAQRYDASGSYRAQWLDAAWQTSPG